jgi:predicted AAA+ superfamily ATPase
MLITGSSSKLLSKEISTLLRGRALGYPLLPLSFKEYQRFSGKDGLPVSTRDVMETRSSLERYLSKGSFPGPFFERGLTGKFYDDYLDLVIYRDLVERYDVSNLGLLKFIIKNVIRSFSKEMSINRLFNDWRSMRYEASKKTLYQYFSYLEDAMFVFPLKKYSRSERTSELSIPKVYLPDTGLASHVIGYQKGRAMENCVYLELLRRSSEGDRFDLHFWRDKSSEVDFVLSRNDRVFQLIQVTESLSRDNHRREIGTLRSFGEKVGCGNLTLITWTGEEEADDDIEVIPLWRFLLERKK